MVVARPHYVAGMIVELQVTPRDFNFGATCNLLPATSTAWVVAADRSCVAVPRMTAYDLSALSCRWFCSNHDRTAAEQLASLSRAGAASLAFMVMSSCVSSSN